MKPDPRRSRRAPRPRPPRIPAGRRRRPRRLPLGTPCPEPEIRRVAAAARAAEGRWDLAMVGDGSTSHDGSCGWAVVVYDRAARTRRVVHGSASDGDSVECELLPYLHAALAHARARRRASRKAVRVLVLTDSQVLVAQWRKFKSGGEVRNLAAAALLGAFPALEAAGYSFSWAWVRKGVLPANRWCDALSRRVRRGNSRFNGPAGGGSGCEMETGDDGGEGPDLSLVRVQQVLEFAIPAGATDADIDAMVAARLQAQGEKLKAALKAAARGRADAREAGEGDAPGPGVGLFPPLAGGLLPPFAAAMASMLAAASAAREAERRREDAEARRAWDARDPILRRFRGSAFWRDLCAKWGWAPGAAGP